MLQLANGRVPARALVEERSVENVRAAAQRKVLDVLLVAGVRVGLVQQVNSLGETHHFD